MRITPTALTTGIFVFLSFLMSAQVSFIDPTGSYILVNRKKDTFNIYTQLDIKYIGGTRIGVHPYINRNLGVDVHTQSLIYEDNQFLWRDTDTYPGCRTIFNVKNDTLIVKNTKATSPVPCFRNGDIIGDLYIRISRKVPEMNNQMDAR